MTKQNKLFSWLGFGKKTEAVPVENAAEQRIQPTEPQADTEVVQLTERTEITEIIAPVEASDVVEVKPEVVQTAALPSATVAAVTELQPQPAERPGFFARLKQGLTKTSQNLGNGLASLFSGKKIDDDLYEELETQLLMADVGVDTSQKLIKQLVQHADRKQLKDADALYGKLQHEMALLLDEVEQPLQLKGADGPFVILMVGVNGVGKTTTIGKMAQQFKQQGKSVMLAAGDTFRAAAVEQLQVWGERNAIPVIAQHSGADSASVIFDAYQAAKARGIDVLIADTAGRLQNKAHLMEELKKIVRVMKKIDANAPHEVMLTLDAGTGQNALSQARLFKEAVDISGISLTKLDGTAKGGVIFAIADQFKLPIRYIGVGEGIDDLRVFDSKDFIKALFARDL
ncbi:signal recognition particle-docking protein FtsY [Rheinheimera sediminis]|uniref:signal recognition particle-docking protein FtsY n=1 Tax=Rheinheimera sp. YQF-1 TaxID=2499626 RepID=UPI000FDB52A7|nr:signal recognition particle-docking protein FtsY [Rheinheimera sp. YQF-1]RVT47846.1 signal recognition particle-docking protein FtsY [Rheinheimera sp. YQF-1]